MPTRVDRLRRRVVVAGSTLALLLGLVPALPASASAQLTKLVAPDGAAGDESGYSVAVSADTAVVGAPLDDVGVNPDQGSVSVFRRSGGAWAYEATLVAFNGAPGDAFGRSVSVSGDTVVVGAFADDVGADADQGSAYVFIRTDGVWTQQQRLNGSGGAAGDQFGVSVAIAKDTIVVGAPFHDVDGSADQGSAYVFIRTDGVWTQQQRLNGTGGAAGDQFGVSVALAKDTAVVGAYLDDGPGGSDQGSAYVFTRSATVWTQQQQLVAAGDADDHFGVSVAVAGDTIAVGASSYEPGSVRAAYVFTRGGGAWTQQQQLVGDTQAFGLSVAVAADTVVVGAYGDNVDRQEDHGSADVFTRSGTVWTRSQHLADGFAGHRFGFAVATTGDTAVIGAPGVAGEAYTFSVAREDTLTSPDAAPSDRFGRAVALSGDTALVGAYNDDVGANSNQGSAYVYVRNGADWTFEQQLTAPDGAVGHLFGASVALADDTAVVGAPNRGSAYVFTRTGGVWSLQQQLVASGGASQFGVSVALAGDTVVVGASRKESPGSAFVFVRTAGVWAQQQQLTATHPGKKDFFGFSVAVSGDTVVVGAHFDDVGANKNQGSAYVFTRTDGVWRQRQRLNASDGMAQDRFGVSVALEGDTVVVGAWNDEVSDSGSASVFTRTDGVWTQHQQLRATNQHSGAQFGASVALSGATIVVGSNHDDVGENNRQGSASVFTRDGDVWTPRQLLTSSVGTVESQFGYSVSISGDTVAVGAYRAPVGGAAYVFSVAGVSVDDVSVAEGDTGLTSLTFTVSRTGGSGTASVVVSTVDGTATAADGDFGPRDETLTFAPGELTQLVTVDVAADVTIEPDETLFLVLSDPTGALIARGRGQGVVANDDPAAGGG